MAPRSTKITTGNHSWRWFLSALLLTAPLLAASQTTTQATTQAKQATTSTTATTKFVLTERVLRYTDTVAALQEAASDPDLPDRIASVAATLGFARLSYYWETTPDDDTEISQVMVGRQDDTCFGVVHGRPLDYDDFVPDPQPLPFDLTRRNCNSNNEDCTCRAQWDWVDRTLPQYWSELQAELTTCMQACHLRNYDQCEMVLGGHGSGGMVAQLLSFYFATTPDYSPYVITSGAANVLYDNDCQGIVTDRYFRFVNTASPVSSNGNTLSSIYDTTPFGVCFDPVPFLGAEDGLVGIGHTIALGLEAGGTGGQALALGGTGQMIMLEDNDATRSFTCRAAHARASYQQKLQRAYLRNPFGVTPLGFSDTQFCQVNEDCKSTSTCQASSPSNGEETDGFPECRAVVVTPQPTASNPTTVRPTPIPTASPTSRPPTKPPTASPSTLRPTEPEETIPPTRGATEIPTASPTMTTVVTTSSPTEAADLIGAPTTITSPTTTTMAPTAGGTAPTDVRDPDGSSLTMSPTTSEGPAGVDDAVVTVSPTTASLTIPSPTMEIPLQNDFFRVTLVLKDVTTKLGGFTVFLWEDETSEHIETFVQKYADDQNWDAPMGQLRVQANIVTQSLLYVTQSNNANPNQSVIAASTKESTGKQDYDDHDDEAPKPTASSRSSHSHARGRVRRSRTRRAQAVTSTTAQALEIVFEVAVSYSSPDTNEIDLLNVVLQAFHGGEGRKQYSKRLKDSKDPVFASLSDFVLQVQDNPNGLATQGGDGGGEDMTIVWALVGAAVVAVAVSLSLFVLYLRRGDSDRQKLEDSTASNPNAVEQAVFEPASSASNPVSRLSSEIVVDGDIDDGISTLGDPMCYPGMQTMMQIDEPTASVNYAQNYLEASPYEQNNTTHFRNGRMLSDNSLNHTAASSSGMTLSKVGSGLTNLNESAIFSDNDSFEEQFAGQDECFEVSVPAGKLGIIIDLSPDSGEPEVRAMRADSFLTDKVKIGDRLLSVDGQGCTELSAEQVSKLIAVKSNQECRKIMFVRRQPDSM